MFTIETIRAALERQRAAATPGSSGVGAGGAGAGDAAAPFVPERRHAAVAMILAGRGADLETCFILRSKRRGDPWSGQVAFPGGRAEPGDADAAAVAERETWEEIGLRLARERCLGALPVQPLNRVHPAGSLSPFVYHPGPEFAHRGPHGWRPTPNHEVSEVFWMPLRRLFERDGVTSIEWVRPGRPETLHPGVEFEGRVIWGLTLRVLGAFAHLLGERLPALEDG